MIAICATTLNNAIGSNGKLIHRHAADLQNFRKLTTGNVVLMGRKTFDEIGKPLPNRENWVLSGGKIDDVRTFSLLSDVLPLCENRRVFVIGGASVYAQTMPFWTEIYLTVFPFVAAGDAFFPYVDWSRWSLEMVADLGGAVLKHFVNRRL